MARRADAPGSDLIFCVLDLFVPALISLSLDLSNLFSCSDLSRDDCPDLGSMRPVTI